MRAGIPAQSIGGGHKKTASWFSQLANATARVTGKPISFVLATGTVVVWAITGPIFHYSDTWQLVINTGTTIVTFLMVFLIQATQNRDTVALQVKLDELILATKEARNEIASIEDETEEALKNAKDDVRQKSGRMENR